MDEADVAVGDHGFDFEVTVGRHDHHQRLRGSDDAADSMHRKLLHRSIDRRAENLIVDALSRLEKILG
jgi:hypothetical protein